MKQVKLNPPVDNLLTELSKTRKNISHINSTKQGIVAELIIALHKREVQQNNVSL